MIMFGKPGAGKGTLAARLMKKYDLVSVSTGDLLRQHITERTDIGREAEGIVARGGLLPDEIVLKVVTGELDALKGKNWILDGFPRTLGQGELLDVHLNKHNTPLTLVVNIDVPDDVILRRIADRWVHLPSGRVYNMSYNRPKVDGLDDLTGEPLTKRPDDNSETFARRLEAFYEATSPLLNHYDAQATTGNQDSRKNLQHPHQVSFHRPHKLKLATLTGATSDENWPHLDELVQQFPGLRARAEVLRMRHSLSDAIVASGLAAANAYRPGPTQAQ
ncbi:ADK-domain-containing protein [Macrolepiota fuliginosa MF-IS2]|uniref:ADK-domain-containing protein n=1 Tax=Macrolepiota fuliginosa MF-IS2 TaxID=1400762 RepID=A0A9P6CAW9_9AGAR|nr:ADK-domain-containing protein [Macrolepiota fuliginosa MF-IS2]